jgi:hypothetical protein
MTSELNTIELVGGPLCGSVIGVDPDKDVLEVPYYMGIAIYFVISNTGKAQYQHG